MPNRYGMAIRAAEAADAEGLAALLQSGGVAVDVRDLASRLNTLAAPSGLVLLAVEWGPPTGVIAVSWAWTLGVEAKVALVTALLVDPEQRRRGVARLLLKAASQAARSAGCGELLMIAAATAAHLQPFGLATGFSRVGGALSRPLRKRGQAEG